MIQFGATLKSAREAKGLTLSQLSEQTRIAHSSLEALENEQFSGFAAPIYVRGFIKLYCAAVGLEAKPLIDEFMAIYNGEREPTIKERPTEETEIIRGELPREEPPATIEPASIEDQTPTETEIEVGAEPSPEPELPLNAPSNFSRYAAPTHDYYNPTRATIPASVWRIILLSVVGIAFLALLFAGIKALHNATSGSTEAPVVNKAAIDEAEVEPVNQTAAPDKADAPKVKRTQQQIPPLYID